MRARRAMFAKSQCINEPHEAPSRPALIDRLNNVNIQILDSKINFFILTKFLDCIPGEYFLRFAYEIFWRSK